MDVKTRIGQGGRVVVPAKFRQALDLQAGDEVILQLDNGQIRLIPLQRAITLAQERVRKYVPEGISLVDELIEERRREATREQA